MRVLHLFGDWKWTGPAEPTLDLCIELRRLGVDVRLACRPAPPEATTNLPARAQEARMEPLHHFAFNKRFNLQDNIRDVRRVRDYCDLEKIDIVHAHFTHDHFLAGFGARKSRRGTRIIRTNHKAVPFPRNPVSRLLFKRLTDGYLSFSTYAVERDRQSFLLEGRAWKINPGMRLERFRSLQACIRDRKEFHLGIVARMQRHRRFDILLQGVHEALKGVPQLRLSIVGRGTRMNEVAVAPARKLGLQDVVTFTGYMREGYFETLAAFDAFIFLVPGSDGTCRALREAMALGLPCIGARRGMIPELLEGHGVLIDDTPQAIAEALVRLAGSAELRQTLGARARRHALSEFDSVAQARRVKEIYETVLKRARS